MNKSDKNQCLFWNLNLTGGHKQKVLKVVIGLQGKTEERERKEWTVLDEAGHVILRDHSAPAGEQHTRTLGTGSIQGIRTSKEATQPGQSGH